MLYKKRKNGGTGKEPQVEKISVPKKSKKKLSTGKKEKKEVIRNPYKRAKKRKPTVGEA